MEHLMNPEYIFSTVFGGGCVWGATKIHIHYIVEKIKSTNEQIKMCDRRLIRLENFHMENRRKPTQNLDR